MCCLTCELQVFNNTARYVDQGGGKRKGAFAIYLEPWHADILPWLELKKNHGIEEERARDLFYGLWVNDLFMKRVEADESWSLCRFKKIRENRLGRGGRMVKHLFSFDHVYSFSHVHLSLSSPLLVPVAVCPNEAPGLAETHSAEFEALYLKYEATPGKARRVLKAREVWKAILDAQTETGTPYMLFKDASVTMHTRTRTQIGSEGDKWSCGAGSGHMAHLFLLRSICLCFSVATPRATSRIWV